MAWPEADDLMSSLLVRARTERDGRRVDGPPRWLEGALLALEAVEAVSATEAANWRARARPERAEAQGGDRAVASERTRQRAREMLEALLTPTRTRNLRKGGEERFRIVLAACEVARIFSPPEVEGWLKRFAEALGEPGPAVERERRPGAAHLLAVVPGAPTDLGELRVRWVELYADCVSITWRVLVPQPEWSPGEQVGDVVQRRVGQTVDRAEAVDLTLTDDVGTDYRSVGPPRLEAGVEAVRSSAAWSETVFLPPVPKGVTRLERTSKAAAQPPSSSRDIRTVERPKHLPVDRACAGKGRTRGLRSNRHRTGCGRPSR